MLMLSAHAVPPAVAGRGWSRCCARLGLSQPHAAAAAAAGGTCPAGAAWSRACGTRCSRDAEVIHHHYDVSNRFYELVLGPSMTYTCALFPTEDATLEEAQFAKYDLVARKLDLQPGQRLLDVGCGWGGMVRHAAREYGVHALGVTLSREQAAWAQRGDQGGGPRRPRRGAPPRLPRRRGDRLRRGQLDRPDRAHRRDELPGVLRLPPRQAQARTAGCSTTASPGRTTGRRDTGAFIDRYVFPDGELTGSGTIITEVQDVGLEVQHEENLRVHYAKTLAGWCAQPRGELGRVRRRGRRGHRAGLGPLHGRLPAGLRAQRDPAAPRAGGQVDEDGVNGFPLRPTW